MKGLNDMTAQIYYFYLNYEISLAEASQCTGGTFDEWGDSRVCELTCEKPREPTCHDVSILIIL